MNTIDFNYKIGQHVYIIGELFGNGGCMCGYGTITEMKIYEDNKKSYYIDPFGWYSEDRVFESGFMFSAKIEEIVKQVGIKKQQDQENIHQKILEERKREFAIKKGGIETTPF